MGSLIYKLTHRFKWTAAIVLLAVAIPGNSCGPFFTEMVFVRESVPDDVAGFLGGNLGVVQSSLIPRYLSLSYRMLSGPSLTAAEQHAALEGWKFESPDPSAGEVVDPAQAVFSDAENKWTQERAQVASTAASASITVNREVPGNQWETYSNCLADAFANAARTLSQRVREHASEKAALADWVQGQDAVFSNCGGNGTMPGTVAQPAWLAQDRAYQTAAAHFYRSEFGPAQSLFEQISSGSDEPRHSLAAYMVGRCLLRSASLSSPDKVDQDLLRKAAEQFRQIAQGRGPYAAHAIELLNMIELRTNPGVAAARLGNAISKTDNHLEQHLVDLAYVHENPELWKHQDDARKSDLVDWELTIGNSGGPNFDNLNHAIKRWHETGNVAWLVAAMSLLKSADPELMRAAAAIQPSSPAWVSLTYYRLKMLPAAEPSRAEAENVLARLRSADASHKTINLFTIVARQKAESLDEFAKLAPMEPAGEDVDGYSPLPAASATPATVKLSTMAGLPVNVAGVQRIDTETAVVLNRQLPLSELVTLVLDSKWTKQLRFELAMAVWTRAVLLDEPEQARRLSKEMIEGEPGWKPWLTDYDQSTTQDERRVRALLALMRFPSVRPYINAGAGREEGFVAYSSYRDNWWCAGMGADSYSTSTNYGAAYPNPNQTPIPAPPRFVTAPMLAQAKIEQDALARIGDASAYFGAQALAWVHDHPRDTRNAELLGFAFRAMRNGCNLENSVPLRHEVFNTLHKNYPNSTWAKAYPEFVEGEQ